GQGRPGRAGGDRRVAFRAARHHDLRPRRGPGGAPRRPPRGVRLHREAAVAGEGRADAAQRGRRQEEGRPDPDAQDPAAEGHRPHRREPRDPRAAAADRGDGADQRAGADLRRERHRQGAGGALHPRHVAAPRGAVRGDELRRHPGGADRERAVRPRQGVVHRRPDRKSTRLNFSHVSISYAVFCLKKKKNTIHIFTAVFLNNEVILRLKFVLMSLVYITYYQDLSYARLCTVAEYVLSVIATISVCF